MNMTSSRILVVDDNEMNRDMLFKRMTRKGFDVTTADGGYETLAYLEIKAFDLVLLDIMMPDIDGLEVLRQIRNNHDSTSLPVIMVSAKTEAIQIGEALELGANDYIEKPIDFKVLLARVNTQLQLKQSIEFRLSVSQQISDETTQRLEAIYDIATESIITVTSDGLIESFNHTAEETFGFKAGEVIGKDMTVLVPIPLRSNHHRHLLEQNTDWGKTIIIGRTREVSGQRKNGEVFPIEICISEIDLIGSRIFSCVVRDISHRKQQEQQIYELANMDTLTGLDNRNQFFIKAEKALTQGKNDNSRLAVIVMDLDRFKEINDNYGHPVGDRVLQEIANRLKEACRQESVIARIGGDEFAILVNLQQNNKDRVEKVLRKIVISFEQPVSFEKYIHYLGVSIGVSFYPDDGDSISDLLRKAEMALYQAKSNLESGYRFFEAHMDTDSWSQKQMLDAMRNAISNPGEFVLFYQPQMCLQSNHCLSAEALIRWISPEFGFVSPADFIPLAEESGLIIPIGTWVLQEGCRQVKRWSDQGLNIRVSLNVSSVQFAKDNFVDNVKQAIEQSGVAPELIELEITEGMVMHNITSVSAKLNEIRALGITISIDDFGTGYSSLSYLKRLPVHCLKIDRSFIMGIPESEEDNTITSAIISMSKALKLVVIAEGVETDEQLEYLRDLQCEYIQGFHFSRPLEVTQFESWLQQRKQT